jgi:hypothetical protein
MIDEPLDAGLYVLVFLGNADSRKHVEG